MESRRAGKRGRRRDLFTLRCNIRQDNEIAPTPDVMGRVTKSRHSKGSNNREIQERDKEEALHWVCQSALLYCITSCMCSMWITSAVRPLSLVYHGCFTVLLNSLQASSLPLVPRSRSGSSCANLTPKVGIALALLCC